MSVTDQLHKGLVLRHEGELFTILDHRLSQTGKQKPTVHVKLCSLRSGHMSERTLDQLGRIEEVPAEMRSMQYLYSTGKMWVFMDTTTFEQYELEAEFFGTACELLVEEEVYRFLFVDAQPVRIELPAHLALEVVDTAAVEHGGGGSNVMKEAKLNCGLTIRVPLFIGTGDRVRVGTEHRDYQGKEH